MGFLKKVQFYTKFCRKRHLPSKPSQFTDEFHTTKPHSKRLYNPHQNKKLLINSKPKLRFIKPIYHSYQPSNIQKIQKMNATAEHIQLTVSRSFILMKCREVWRRKNRERALQGRRQKGCVILGNSFNMLMLLSWPAIKLFGTPKRRVTAHKISLQTMKLYLFHHPLFNSNGNS